MITLKGSAFKKLVSGVTAFPSVGSFAGSEIVTLYWAGGKLLAVASGLVVARARCLCEGSISNKVAMAIGIDERSLSSFAGIVSPLATVTIDVEENKVVMATKRKRVRAPLAQARKYEKLVLPSDKLKIDKVMARRISYLSEVAFSDTSRAELCCVMLTRDGKALAVNQKTSASMHGIKLENAVPVPLQLAKVLKEGDILYPGKDQIVLKSNEATYAMPSMSVAVAKYPLQLMEGLDKKTKNEIAVVDGTKLGNLLSECNVCLGSVAKTEVVVGLTVEEGRLQLKARNAGFEFESAIKLIATKGKCVFHAPLEDIMRSIPFLDGKVVLSRGEHGELFLVVKSGYIVFPAWVEQKKRKK